MGQPIELQLEELRDNAISAVTSGDLDTALRLATAALALIALIPDSSQGQMSTLNWDRSSIQGLIAELKRQGAKATLINAPSDCGIEVCNVEWVGVDGSGCGGCCT